MGQLNQVVIHAFAVLTILGQIISVGLIGFLIFKKINPKNKKVVKLSNLISDNYVPIILVVSAGATFGSLSFSEVLGFTPCKLCWYQRIFIYPQFIIASVALFTNETKIKKYILSLSIIGFLIGVYHILVQLFPQALECSDEVAKCSFKEFATFGYITIPVMSVTAFAMLILFSLISSRNK